MNYLVFDTETTDLIKNMLMPLDRQPHIIEFFGLTLNNELEEKDSFHSLFNNGKKLGMDTVRITGITDEILKDAPKFKDKAVDLKHYIESHDYAIAHNATFDRDVVDVEMKRIGMEIEWPKLICTVEATEYIKGHRLRLADLHEVLFGEKFEGAHRAENDVRALARCAKELIKTGII